MMVPDSLQQVADPDAEQLFMEMRAEEDRRLVSCSQLESGVEFAIERGNLSHRYRTERRERRGKTYIFVDYYLRHSHEWVYLGLFQPDAVSGDEESTLKMTRGSRLAEDSVPARVFRWVALRSLWCDEYRLRQGSVCRVIEEAAQPVRTMDAPW